MNDLLYVCSLIALEGRVKTSSKMACFLWILSVQSDAWKAIKNERTEWKCIFLALEVEINFT